MMELLISAYGELIATLALLIAAAPFKKNLNMARIASGNFGASQ